MTPPHKKRYFECFGRYGKAVLVIGDSHGIDLFNSFAFVSDHPFIVSVSKGGYRVATPGKDCPYGAIREFLLTHKHSISLLTYTQNGSYFLTDSVRLPIDDDYANRTKECLEEISHMVNTLWLGSHIKPRINLEEINFITTSFDQPLTHFDKKLLKAVDKQMKEVSRNASFLYVSKIDLISYDPNLDFIVDGNFTYSDIDHWSSFGEKYFGKRLLKDKILSKHLLY